MVTLSAKDEFIISHDENSGGNHSHIYLTMNVIATIYIRWITDVTEGRTYLQRSDKTTYTVLNSVRRVLIPGLQANIFLLDPKFDTKFTGNESTLEQNKLATLHDVRARGTQSKRHGG